MKEYSALETNSTESLFYLEGETFIDAQLRANSDALRSDLRQMYLGIGIQLPF